MKKFFYVAILINTLLLLGCKKDLIDYLEGSSSKKYSVDFKIGGLNHIIGQPNVGFQTEPIKNYILHLSVIVYNAETGLEVAREMQSSTDLDFGKIAFELPSANYNFVAVGSKSPFGINLFYQTPTTIPVNFPFNEAYFQYLQGDQSEGEKHYKTTDTFVAKTTAKITTDKTVDLMMQRIIGQIEISFSDVSVFGVELHREATAYKFDAESSFAGITRRPQFEVNTAQNGPFKLEILNTNQDILLDVFRLPSYPKRILIPVRKNKVTKVSGKILTDEYLINIQN